MKIARNLPDLHAALDELGPVGLVPTMGALHRGHLSLVAAARQAGQPVAASIFVNPLQFGPSEDLARYPRDEAGDLAQLEQAGCDLVWLPDVATMYPPEAASTITVGGPATLWEGMMRPGHFSGVATVVAKLFGQVRPRAAYFGEKDWQQVQVIRRFTTDFLLPVEIVPVPTVRETDGLALSSRNRFLTPAERQTAPALHAALTRAASAIGSGDAVATSLDVAKQELIAAGMAPDYLALVGAETLEPLERLTRPARLIAAARLGSVRLLDNVPVD
ncbi:MAG TPA: pantoate--beta-alanine ligase [Acidocella sp.]|jgi:pantoate--beta-alanine ligase|uniref:pantoate--beta-alanine ligase n=1 Tax=Acidocella sp. TaxID=50710 RepID=UPI002C59F594|nr:pantoate--beta-alanine ligase [Acidocella sp.]HVE23376.1 pantoate--beta-alanine ligase [Acidocella sp.]